MDNLKHSNVFYIYRRNKDKSFSFHSVKEAKVFKNDFGLDLFTYEDKISEGKTGVRICDTIDIAVLSNAIERNGGIEKLNEIISKQIEKTGLSPRYTRPDEKKNELFPPKEKDPNKMTAKNEYNERHHYIKFQSEHNGVTRDFYLLENQKDEHTATLYVLCNGVMIAIDQKHRIKCAHEAMGNINDDIFIHVKTQYEQAINNECTWVNLGYAMILDKVEEAKQHNEIIRQMRKAENDKQDAERKAKREQREKEKRQALERQILEAEQAIKNQEQIINNDVQDLETSIVLFLMKKHSIQVPLKTQGWINSALYSLKTIDGEYSYQYYKKSSDSTVFRKYLNMLVEKIQAV